MSFRLALVGHSSGISGWELLTEQCSAGLGVGAACQRDLLHPIPIHRHHCCEMHTVCIYQLLHIFAQPPMYNTHYQGLCVMCGTIFPIPSFNTIINRVYSINSSSFSHHHPIQTPPSTQHQSPFDAQDCSIAPSGSSNVPPFTSPPSSTNHYMPLQSIYASDKYCLSPSSF